MGTGFKYVGSLGVKLFVLAILLFSPDDFCSQVNPGFEPTEARDMIAICNSYTFLDLYGSDTAIIPRGYKKTFTSETIGMDNQFQIYRHGKLGVIHFRGSTAKASSWIENMYSAMIPAKGSVLINKEPRSYAFSNDTSASVHSGYALAILLQSSVLIKQINQLNDQGIHAICITGHSQGGALATLCRAYLELLPSETIHPRNQFKTYSFAAPMVGNKAFSEYYNSKYADNETSYRIINPSDAIQDMPIHFDEESKFINSDRIINTISGKEKLSLKKLGIELVARNFERTLANHIGHSNRQIERFVSKTIHSIEMPEYTKDINYYKSGKVLQLEPFAYPQIEVADSLHEEFDKSVLIPKENGKYYRKEPAFYQHKPYNYYVGVLQKYLPKKYNSLNRKYLPENL